MASKMLSKLKIMRRGVLSGWSQRDFFMLAGWAGIPDRTTRILWTRWTAEAEMRKMRWDDGKSNEEPEYVRGLSPGF
jgi:hypothetical protein